MDSRFGSIDGVLRTTTGYTGGTAPDPTYRRLGDHSEAVRVEYDPERVTYRDLLRVFWSSHDPRAQSWSRQYRNALFYHTPEQRRLALASKESVEAEIGQRVRTDVEPAGRFYPAEGYHQKYALRGYPGLWAELQAHYPSEETMLASAAAARLNGYVGGYGTPVEGDLEALGLSAEARQRVLRAIGRWLR